MEFPEQFYLLAVEQFGGRKDHEVITAALNKRIAFDIRTHIPESLIHFSTRCLV